MPEPGPDRLPAVMRDETFPDLRAFLARLRRDRDLAVVDVPVAARLEAAEIHRRVIAAGGPALLFTKVRGAEMPLATNLARYARVPITQNGADPFSWSGDFEGSI